MNGLIGRFALSKAGHDKDTLYVVIRADEKFLYLCDGKFHGMHKLKKKSRKHVMLYNNFVSSELLQRMMNEENIFDHEIKYAIKMQINGKEEGYV